MQFRQTNYKKEWKERRLRPKSYSQKDPAKTSTLNFSDFAKSTTRNEMPSKYETSQVPKIELERIYHLNLLRKSQSMSSAPITPIEAPNASQKPSAYLSNNGIQSVEEFLEMHKTVKILQKKQDKIDAMQAIVNKRLKLEEAHMEKTSSLTARGFSNPYILSSERPYSSNLSGKVLVRPGFLPTAKPPLDFSSLERINFDSTASRIRIASTDRVNREKYDLSSKNNLDVTATFGEIGAETAQEINNAEDTTPLGGFITNQKFTEKEIMRHFSKGNISPKPLRQNGKSFEREKTYFKMYQSSKTLDLAIESTIKKATKIISSQDQTKTRVKERSKDFEHNRPISNLKARSASFVGQKNEKYNGASLTAFAIDISQESGQTTLKMIKKSIDNINSTLSTAKQKQNLLEKLSTEKDDKTAQKTKTRPRIMLRSQVEQKYNFPRCVEYNRILNDKIKDLTKTMRKEVPASAISNQNYVKHFT